MKWQMTVVETMNRVLAVLVLDFRISASLFMNALKTRASATTSKAMNVDHDFSLILMDFLSSLSAITIPKCNTTYEIPRITSINKKVITFILVFWRDYSPRFSQMASSSNGAVVTNILYLVAPTFIAIQPNMLTEYFLQTWALSQRLLKTTTALVVTWSTFDAVFSAISADLISSFSCLALTFGFISSSFNAKQVLIFVQYQFVNVDVFLKNRISLISIVGSISAMAFLISASPQLLSIFLKNRAYELMSMMTLLFLLATMSEIMLENIRNKKVIDLRIRRTVSISSSPFCLITSARSILLIIQTPNTWRQLLSSFSVWEQMYCRQTIWQMEQIPMATRMVKQQNFKREKQDLIAPFCLKSLDMFLRAQSWTRVFSWTLQQGQMRPLVF